MIEYFHLLRSQIKDGAIRRETHLDVLGVLKDRISILEKEWTSLRNEGTIAKRTIAQLTQGTYLSRVNGRS